MSTPMNKEQLLQAAKLITLAAEGKFTKQAKQQYYGFKGVDYISRTGEVVLIDVVSQQFHENEKGLLEFFGI